MASKLMTLVQQLEKAEAALMGAEAEVARLRREIAREAAPEMLSTLKAFARTAIDQRDTPPAPPKKPGKDSTETDRIRYALQTGGEMTAAEVCKSIGLDPEAKKRGAKEKHSDRVYDLLKKLHRRDPLTFQNMNGTFSYVGTRATEPQPQPRTGNGAVGGFSWSILETLKNAKVPMRAEEVCRALQLDPDATPNGGKVKNQRRVYKVLLNAVEAGKARNKDGSFSAK